MKLAWPRVALIFLGAQLGYGGNALAADTAQAVDPVPQRPKILFNRWQEDWSVLVDPRIPREPFDGLKYMPLSDVEPKTYLSLGANVRERFESNDAVLFGTSRNTSQRYVISRTELHADLHVDSQWQMFVQLQSDFAPGKSQMTSVDQDRLGVEQAFIALTEPLDDGTLKVRVGRQQFAFDMQRFVSVRDGPNVRQSYDAAWADYEKGRWRFITFYSQPVQTRDERIFDDSSSRNLTFSGLRVERQLTQQVNLAAYYARFTQEEARYLTAMGNELRNVFDTHLTGLAGPVDWDIEGMKQNGHVGNKNVAAWGFGSLAGYTLVNACWSPRLGIQVDAASGNHDPNGHTLGTFNPLFPNGAYLALAGYTGYTNFIQVKPSVTVHPSPTLKIMIGVAQQWRQSTSDAVYAQPTVPVPNTAGRPGKYTGSYEQLRVDWAYSRAVSFALEAVHFNAASVIRRAGGHDSNYVGIQTSLGW
ncbi:alginate export family protein [Dyella sp.]|uniref:alginate export family protein n=1 Tax=Dyella sp. TaxID=1869338 RepID=UPI002ED4D1E8